MNVTCLTATEPGRLIAGRLPYRHLHGKVGESLRQHWGEVDGFVVVLAVGATVRLLAPLLAGKERDPSVVCVDDAGRYAVVVCGGHAGGGNALAGQVAGLLGAEPVVTTATDNLGIPALDQLPGLVAEGDVAAVTAALLAGAPISCQADGGWPLPPALEDLVGGARLGAEADAREPRPAGSRPAARILVTDRLAPPARGHGTGVPPPSSAGSPSSAGLPVPTVRLRPPSLVVGIGTATDATAGDAERAVAEALAAGGLSPRAVDRLATVDRRRWHPGVLAPAGALGVPVVAFSPGELDTVEVPSPNPVVREAVGTASVAEAAALLGAGAGSALAVPKRRSARVTVAVARRSGPAGSVTVVGLGPGGALHRTPAAEAAVRRAQVVVGYSGYLDQCRDLLSPAQEVTGYPLGAELQRARAALDKAAAGRRVAVVCSGDAGVYAMASPILELAGERAADGSRPYAGTEIDVVPGVTASLAAAALLGAPLGHDHAVVSLSDLLTPWERIAARVQAAAAADLVLVLYNPRSQRRDWQLGRALDLLRACRDETTPVGLVTDAGRPGQRVVLTTLAEVRCEDVTMTTCVVVGASTTRVVAGRMVTPRGYDR